MKAFLISTILMVSPLVSADTYKIDTELSRVTWKAGKKTGTFHNGNIKVKSGQVETDAKGTVKSLDVIVDMKTIANEDLKDTPEYQVKLVGHLSSEDFFNVAKYPEATFKLTSISPKPGASSEFTVKGNLTIIGKSVAVEFPAKISTDKNKLVGKATLIVQRLLWGLKYGSGSIFKALTADKIINDSFELTLDLVAKK